MKTCPIRYLTYYLPDGTPVEIPTKRSDAMNYEELDALGKTLAQVGDNEQKIADIIGRLKKVEHKAEAAASETRVQIMDNTIHMLAERLGKLEHPAPESPAPEFRVGYPVGFDTEEGKLYGIITGITKDKALASMITCNGVYYTRHLNDLSPMKEAT